MVSKLNIEKIQEWILTPWGYGSIALVTGFLALVLQSPKPTDKPVVSPNYETVDTHIPEGKALILIEITNYESLDSIIGKYGVVDLFTTPLSEKKKARAIAFAVKILRAPNNPNHFAVLVGQNQAEKILAFPGPFSVTIRNPKTSGTEFVKAKVQKKKRRIIFDSDL